MTTTHDDYLATFPPEQRDRLERLRAIVHAAAPGATETIGYGIPTFRLFGRNFVHYAGFARHDSFFPGSATLTDSLDGELAPWRAGRGTLRFPHGSEIPWELVERIVRLRVAEEAARDAGRAAKRGRARPSPTG